MVEVGLWSLETRCDGVGFLSCLVLHIQHVCGGGEWHKAVFVLVTLTLNICGLTVLQIDGVSGSLLPLVSPLTAPNTGRPHPLNPRREGVLTPNLGIICETSCGKGLSTVVVLRQYIESISGVNHYHSLIYQTDQNITSEYH